MEAGSQLDQWRNHGSNLDLAPSGRVNAADELQQSALSRAISPHDADELAGHDLERNVAQGRELNFSLVSNLSAQQVDQERLEAGRTIAPISEFLRDMR